jgi:hypothetical protein
MKMERMPLARPCGCAYVRAETSFLSEQAILKLEKQKAAVVVPPKPTDLANILFGMLEIASRADVKIPNAKAGVSMVLREFLSAKIGT